MQYIAIFFPSVFFAIYNITTCNSSVSKSFEIFELQDNCFGNETVLVCLEASFSEVNRSYHAIALFIISEEDREPVLQVYFL